MKSATRIILITALIAVLLAGYLTFEPVEADDGDVFIEGPAYAAVGDDVLFTVSVGVTDDIGIVIFEMEVDDSFVPVETYYDRYPGYVCYNAVYNPGEIGTFDVLCNVSIDGAEVGVSTSITIEEFIPIVDDTVDIFCEDFSVCGPCYFDIEFKAGDSKGLEVVRELTFIGAQPDAVEILVDDEWVPCDPVDARAFDDGFCQFRAYFSEPGDVRVAILVYTEDEYVICGDSVDMVIAGHEYEDGVCIVCGAEEPLEPEVIPYDINGDGKVNLVDPAWLILNILFGDENFPVNQDCDFNGDGKVNHKDLVVLVVALM